VDRPPLMPPRDYHPESLDLLTYRARCMAGSARVRASQLPPLVGQFARSGRAHAHACSMGTVCMPICCSQADVAAHAPRHSRRASAQLMLLSSIRT
jgi:hypothetical protein